MSAGVAGAAAALLGAGVRRVVPIAGGDLNAAFRLELADGRAAFAKTSPDAAPGAYGCEAAGLRWLAEPGAICVPEVLGVADAPGATRLLVLEWIDQAPRAPGFDEALGRGLALVHAAGAPAFGAERPTVLGPLTLPAGPARKRGLSPFSHGWAEFYGACRIEPMARAAEERGALPPGGRAAIDRVLGRLPELVGPEEPPARLHGDLWSGNVMAGPGGVPVLIDPAAYGGHREVDLAMLALFGTVSPRLLAAYEDVAPLAAGHEERRALHQLFPLLVHAVLFGGGYGASAVRAAQRYL